MKVHRVDPRGRGRRFAVVVSRFNEVVTARLLEGALAALDRHGVADDDVEVAWTPGAFEIPLAAQRLARSDQFDGLICLGALVRGETAHFDHVATQAAEGIRLVSMETGVPCGFGVLTVDSLDQALERAGGTHGNRGWETATAVIEMAELLEALPKQEG